jgi:hypothetical protein
MFKNHQDKHPGWALVAHVYNPSYSGGRDQDNRKPFQADPISKNKQTNKQTGLVERLKV